MQIQLDIPKEISDKLSIYKINNNLVNKKEAIKIILIEFFDSKDGK
jgi:hypothetical protein